MIPLMRLPWKHAAVVALLAAILLVLVPSPSSAHPFGDPQTVSVEQLEDDGLRVRWRAGGTDDLTLLAVALGLLPKERVLLDGAVFPEEGDAHLLATAPEFADYVLERIAVGSGEASCRGTVAPVTDLATAGVAVDFRCPARIETAAVTVRMLTDLHPAYRALASGPDGQRASYDVDHDTHEWSVRADAATSGGSLAAEQDLGRSAALQLGGVLGLAGTAAALVVAARVRARRAARSGGRA